MLLIKILNESKASDDAKRRGLEHAGYGKWRIPGGPIVARTVKDKLVAIKSAKKKQVSKKSDNDIIDASIILDKKIGYAKGSNPGGFYIGSDGQKRYVKFYKNPSQGKSEHLANNIYKDLGIGSPISHLFDSDGKEAFASDIIEGKLLNETPLTPQLAKKILGGFAADVLTSNWDVVGLEHDNILVDKAGNPYRIDNGGTFTFRAMGGAKPQPLLNQIPEFKGFSDHHVNSEYAQLFDKLGYHDVTDMGQSFIKQVQDIVKLRKKVGSWEKYIQKTVPSFSPQEQKTIAKMLESRMKLMIEKAREMK